MAIDRTDDDLLLFHICDDNEKGPGQLFGKDIVSHPCLFHFTPPIQDLYPSFLNFNPEPFLSHPHPVQNNFNLHNTYVTEQNSLYGLHAAGRQQICAGTRSFRN